MLNRISQRLRYWFKPIRCSECKRRCLSVQGLGRHRAAHERKRPAPRPLTDRELRAAAGMQNSPNAFGSPHELGQQAACGVSDCKLPMPHNHFQEAK